MELKKYINYRNLTLYSLSALPIAVMAESEKVKLSTGTESILSVLMSLMIVLAVILACAFVLKKIQNGPTNKSAPIQIVSTQMIGVKEKLMVVHVDGKTLLLGITPSSINKLELLSETFGGDVDRNALNANRSKEDEEIMTFDPSSTVASSSSQKASQSDSAHSMSFKDAFKLQLQKTFGKSL